MSSITAINDVYGNYVDSRIEQFGVSAPCDGSTLAQLILDRGVRDFSFHNCVECLIAVMDSNPVESIAEVIQLMDRFHLGSKAGYCVLP